MKVSRHLLASRCALADPRSSTLCLLFIEACLILFVSYYRLYDLRDPQWTIALFELDRSFLDVWTVLLWLNMLSALGLWLHYRSGRARSTSDVVLLALALAGYSYALSLMVATAPAEFPFRVELLRIGA